jgi:GntR family transcriptional regulator
LDTTTPAGGSTKSRIFSIRQRAKTTRQQNYFSPSTPSTAKYTKNAKTTFSLILLVFFVFLAPWRYLAYLARNLLFPLDRSCTTRHNTPVIPFRVEFRPGASLYEQVVYAAKKALVSGQLRPGDAFPSVRTLSAELKINPNTAHKIITHLLNDGLLEVMPGTGTVVARPPHSTARERTRLLENEVEQLVVEAKKLGIGLPQVAAALAEHWERLDAQDGAETPSSKGGRRKT